MQIGDRRLGGRKSGTSTIRPVIPGLPAAAPDQLKRSCGPFSALASAELFALRPASAPQAVRLALGYETSRERLAQGFEVIAELLADGEAGRASIV